MTLRSYFFRSDFNIYKSFLPVMAGEQEEFQQFAREHFTHERNLAYLAQLSPEQLRYANEYQEQKVARARKYPRLYAPYAPAQLLRLRPMVAEEGGPRPQFEMRLEKTLVDIGKLPKVNLKRFLRLGAKF